MFLRIQVRASSQTKGLERGWKQRVRLARDAKNTDCPFCIRYFRSNYPLLSATHWLNFNATCLLSRTPHGRVRLVRFARVRLLRHGLPISLLILKKQPTVFQSNMNRTPWGFWLDDHISFKGIVALFCSLLKLGVCRLKAYFTVLHFY